MYRLRPVLSAISARAGSDYRTGEREMGSAMAFEDQPTLKAAMLGELSGRINEQAGTQFAGAAAGAYGDAERTFEDASQFKKQMRLNSAMGAGSLYRGSMVDMRRQGGLLSEMMSQGAGRGIAKLGSLAGV
jgi:hypothetical protein